MLEQKVTKVFEWTGEDFATSRVPATKPRLVVTMIGGKLVKWELDVLTVGDQDFSWDRFYSVVAQANDIIVKL